MPALRKAFSTSGATPTGFARAEFVRANSAEVGVPETWIPGLGVLKTAGAAGLLLGLLGVPFIGAAAAAGLVLFFVCAVAVHIRKRVLHNIAFPGGFLALALASFGLAVTV
ncbi:DoxX family protein [Streptomyces sp. NPDC059875]|uniref:DoxX family protein n=1 Tax=unclassified Streptomyces TaxID=2593676 RepID=UPI00365A1BBE